MFNTRFNRLTLLTIALVSLFALALAPVAPAPAAAQDDDADYTYLRIAHLSYATGGLDVYIDGQPSDIQAVQFGDLSGWVEMTPGTYSIAFVPVDETLDDAVLGPFNYGLEDDAWTMLTVTGSDEDTENPLTLQPLRLDYSDINQGDARVAVFHGISGAPAVDLTLEDGTVLAEDLPYVSDDVEGGFEAGMTTFNVSAGTYDVSIVPTGETDPVLLTLGQTEFEAGTFYFIAVAGTPDDPVTVMDSITISDLESMTNASFGDDMMSDDDMDDDSDDDMDDSMDDMSDDADDDSADDMNDDMSDDAEDDMGDDDSSDDSEDDSEDDSGDDDMSDDS